LKRLVLKGKGKLWPTVTWKDTQLVVCYLSDFDDEVVIRETRGIDFNEFFFHLDGGGSIFVTVRPTNEGTTASDMKSPLQESRKVVDIGHSSRRDRPLEPQVDSERGEEDVRKWMTR
jgi:hypothetical protein